MKKKIYIIALVSLFALVGSVANAQVRSADIVLQIYPENPAPNQNVEVKLSSYATDLDKAFIVWTLNQNKMAGGIGRKSFSFTTGPGGDTFELTAAIETASGQNLIKNVRITPINMDILWEATDSYVPPFYRGKALVPGESSYKVVAMPNIRSVGGGLNLSNLSYEWRKDGRIQTTDSGWGKSFFIFRSNYLDKSNVIGVKASDLGNKTSAEGGIELVASSPKILFYEKDPDLGVKMQEALRDGYEINKDGIEILAVPYFVSPRNLGSRDLTFKWTANGQEIFPDGTRKNQINIKPDRGASGFATLKLQVKNIKALLSDSEKVLEVKL
jgi:hypothetical protein